MEKKGVRRLFFIGIILYFVGASVWGILVFAVPQRDYYSGSILGSADKDIVMHFHATSRRNFWEISYTTSSFYAVIYKFDQCNYEAYLEGQPLASYETLLNDQNTPIKLKIDTPSCKGNKDIYVVWDFWKGTGNRVEYDAVEAHFYKATGVTIYFSVGAPIFGIGLFMTSRIGEIKTKIAIKRIKKQKAQINHNRRKCKMILCPSCGNEISLISEYCTYCGNETQLGQENKSKIDYDKLNA